jgi:hypothetical protein
MMSFLTDQREESPAIDSAGILTPHLLMMGVMMAWCVVGTPAKCQSTAAHAAPRARVMVLGTYHFENPGLDVVKSEVADVLAPAKQTEMARVVEALARFRPTKIAVEVRAEGAPRLDSLYSAYAAGRDSLGRSEVQQLGFRLARRFGHTRLFAIDHGGEFPFGAVMQYAQEHDPSFVQRVQRLMADLTSETNRNQRRKSIGDILRLENDPKGIERGHAMYLEMASVGAGDTYVGADLLAKWYRRNILIFSDVQRIAQPGDRMLVIFGSGHSPILRELISGDARLELVEPNQYLGAR